MKRAVLAAAAVVAVTAVFVLAVKEDGRVKPWSIYEGRVCNFGSCYTSEMNQKFYYWLDQAAANRDPGLCRRVEGLDNGDYQDSKEEAEYFCRAQYGGKTGDLNYCLGLENSIKYSGTATQEYICLQELLNKVTNTGDCDKWPTDTYPVNAKYECLTAAAANTGDANTCLKIPEAGYNKDYRGSRKNCLIGVGKKMGDAGVCGLLSQEYLVSECEGALKR